MINDTITSPWAPKEEYDHSPLPELEYFDTDEESMLASLIDSVKRRIDARDAQQEESARNGRTFRKVLFVLYRFSRVFNTLLFRVQHIFELWRMVLDSPDLIFAK